MSTLIGIFEDMLLSGCADAKQHAKPRLASQDRNTTDTSGTLLDTLREGSLPGDNDNRNVVLSTDARPLLMPSFFGWGCDGVTGGLCARPSLTAARASGVTMQINRLVHAAELNRLARPLGRRLQAVAGQPPPLVP